MPGLSLKFTPLLAARIVGCAALSTLGVHYIGAGKEHADFGKMIRGALLVMLGLACFL